MVFATDYGADSLYFFQAKVTNPPLGNYVAINPGIANLPGIGARKQKSFLSRDELATTHVSGDPADPIHNLGFLPSTAAHPDRTYFYDTNDWIVRDIAPNLKYLDFDPIKANYDIASLYIWPTLFREIFDKKLHPSWQWNARYLDIFGNTEGGAIPSSIEASAPYTPINVANFDKNLNATVNNLQALADRVDELDTGPSIHAGTAIDPPDDADEFPVVDVSLATPAVKRFSWVNNKSRMFEAFGPLIDAATKKPTPVAADVFPIMDSELMGKTIKGLTLTALQTLLLTPIGNLTMGTYSVKGDGKTLSDDTAWNFTPNAIDGFMFIRTSLYNDWAIVLFKTTTTNALTIITGGANFTSAIDTQLTGTTGADGKINISVDDAVGKFYIENRLGGSRSFRWMIFCSS